MSPEERCPSCGVLGPCEHRPERQLAVNYAPMMPRKTPIASPRAVRVPGPDFAPLPDEPARGSRRPPPVPRTAGYEPLPAAHTPGEHYWLSAAQVAWHWPSLAERGWISCLWCGRVQRDDPRRPSACPGPAALSLRERSGRESP